MQERKILNLKTKLIIGFNLMAIVSSTLVLGYVIHVFYDIQDARSIFNKSLEFLLKHKINVSIALVMITAISVMISLYIVNTLNKIFRKIKQLAIETNNISMDVKNASQGFSSATDSQVSAIQETISTLNEINLMVRCSVDSAVKSSELSDNLSRMAKEGYTTVDEMVRTIEDINHSNENIMQQINKSNKRITEIVEVITQISDKTKVINDIVFQTKLLSFNASVEAARAGVHGKGFSVVAEEVGSLAQISGNAAKEISEMLSESINKVEGIVGETSRSVEGLMALGREKVNSGVVIARRCGEVLEDVVRDVDAVNSMIGEITEVSKQQSKGVNNISTAMGQLDHSTHKNADKAYKSLEYAEKLINHANNLRHYMYELELNVYGKATSSKNQSKPKITNIENTFSINKKSKYNKKIISIKNHKEKIETKSDNKKLVVGGEIIPSEDDSRCEDI